MIELVTADVIDAIIEETNVSVQEAMKTFYDSEVFFFFFDTETGMYL
jgi:hypothetical protein